MTDSTGEYMTPTTESTLQQQETKIGLSFILTYIQGFSQAERKRCLTALHAIQQPILRLSAHSTPAESVLQLQTLLAQVLKGRQCNGLL